MAVFWDVHSHVVPSGDDGAQSLDEGLALCRTAAERGTSVLFATPHVWPSLTLTQTVRNGCARRTRSSPGEAASFGLDLRLGAELHPAAALLDEDLRRYRLGDLPAVLMELPFHGPLGLAEALAERIQGSGLVPVIAHPERSEAVVDDPGIAAGLRARGWLLQMNATSVLGYHGAAIELTAWRSPRARGSSICSGPTATERHGPRPLMTPTASSRRGWGRGREGSSTEARWPG